jgi:hypothetical protein
MSATHERLTRLPYEPRNDEELDQRREAIRAALHAELAPQSLADRLIAEGIEGIACRLWHQGYDAGYSSGSVTGFTDSLRWLRMYRDEAGGVDKAETIIGNAIRSSESAVQQREGAQP